MKKIICPACGSNHLKKNNYQETVSENLGGSLSINKVLYHCEDCGFEGDLFNENEPIIEQTIQSLKSDLVISILEGFSSNKISLSSMERALDLPQRTLTKWKNGASSPTSAGITLLKFIKLFPWLLEVAENKFNYVAAQRIHLNVAWQKIVSHMTFNENDYGGPAGIATANSGIIFFYVKPPEDTGKDLPIIEIQSQALPLLSTS
jgi:hypothetical protein